MTDTVAQLVQLAHPDAIHVSPKLLALFLFAVVLFVAFQELGLRLPSLILGPPDERQPL